jgi:large subunit ribosomal protein L25
VSEVRIAAEPRTEFGKGAARRVRREHKVPAVLYGHGAEPRHISLPGHELMLALKSSNVLLTIELDGDTELALPKQVQRDPIKGFLEHVDLIVVTRGEKVTVEVPVVIQGDIAPGGLLNQDLNTVTLETEATHIPSEVVVDVEGLPVGSHITAADLKLPEGSTLAGDPDLLVLSVVAAPTAEQVEAELGGGETAAEAPAVEPQPAADQA